MISSQPVARNNFRTFSVSLPALRVLCHQNAGTISIAFTNMQKLTQGDITPPSCGISQILDREMI